MSLDRKLTYAERADKALEIIKNHRALIQAVSDQGEPDQNGITQQDYSEIDDLLNQLYDPNQYRPSRSTECFKIAGKPLPETLQKTNLKTGEVTTISPGTCRYTKHKDVEFKHTAKTSTSLLPPEPQYMNTFGQGSFIHFGWDIDACDIKDERYVWAEDAGTDCQWLSPYPNPNDDPNGIDEVFWSIPLSSIAGLREKNNKAVADKNVIDWNEILAGLPKRRVDFMFVCHEDIDYRLRIWKAMQRTKDRMGFEDDIPVFVINNKLCTGESGVRLYTPEEHEEDLKEANKLKAKNQLITHKLNAKLNFYENRHQLFAIARTSEKNQFADRIEKLITVLNKEINSHWPYPNKDRKRTKVAMLRKMKSIILTQEKEDVRSFIDNIADQYPDALEGKLSNRTNNLISDIKIWSGYHSSKDAIEMKSLPAA